MRARYEAQDGGKVAVESIGAIAKDFGVSQPTVTNQAKARGWKRPSGGQNLTKKPAAPTTGGARMDEPEQLKGRVRCTECESMTSTNPCEYCGKKLRKNWG